MVAKSRVLLLILLGFFVSRQADARRELIEFYRSPRAMGMGNAFTAISDDHDAVFYNPAGIAFNTGVELRLLNPKFEVSTDALKLSSQVKSLGSSGFNADAMKALLGKNIYGSGVIYPSILVSNFTLGYFADFNASIVANNEALPAVNLNYYYDQGVVGGTGFDIPFGKFHHLRAGVTVKALSRAGVDRKIPITSIATSSGILKSLKSDTGFGVGVSPGLQYEHPLSPRTDMVYGVVWHDIGDTKFGNRLSDTNRAPPSIPSNLAAGVAVIQRFSKREGYNGKFSVEGRHLNRTAEDPRKKIHVGGELALGMISVQAGLSQLRWTAGLTLDVLFMEVAVSSYSVETLALWSMSSERRYAAQFTFKLDATGSRDRNSAERERRKRPRQYR